MSREPREVWVDRVRRWGASGLSGLEFARQEGVRRATLSWWRWRLRAEQRRAPVVGTPGSPAAVQFVELAGLPVAPVPDRPFEVVLVGGAAVRVPREFDDAALGRLLDLLERR